MKKDKKVTVRINSDIKTMMEEDGVSPQKIVDEYIEKNYKVSIERKKEDE